jgi:hypothetical protein
MSETSNRERVKSPGQSQHRLLHARLSVRDLLAVNLGKLHHALSSDPAHTGLTLRASYRLFAWSERHGAYRTKILYCPPLNLLWRWRPGDDPPAMVAHKAYNRAVWAERGTWGRLRLLAAILLVWAPLNVALSAWTTWLNGRSIARRAGKPILSQVVEQVRLSARHGVLPPWYYVWELYDGDRRADVAHYLHRYETKGGLFRMLKSGVPGRRTPLPDKSLFATHCATHDLAVLGVVGFLRDGKALAPDGGALALPPGADLFAKPVKGRGGEGAEWWAADAGSLYRGHDGRVLSMEELMAHFLELARVRPYLVQERGTNHSAIADLGAGALCTVRMLTCETEDGRYEATNAVFRMSVGGNNVVDNFHAGGIAAPIDMATGELGSATDMGLRPERGWCAAHPDTGAPIAGRRLPFWRETKDLACRAHAAFSDRVVIGWDIAILERGPCLVEGNGAPDVDLIQRPCRAPLGKSRFGELLAHHLRRLDADRA